jgi:hypothetical protein
MIAVCIDQDVSKRISIMFIYRRRGLIAVALSILLSACAGTAQQQLFAIDAPPTPVFSGSTQGIFFQRGTAVYEDEANTSFTGKFDSNGFPRRGELMQSYRDQQGQLLSLHLVGEFSMQMDQQLLKFTGSFELKDFNNRILAEADQSHWQGGYAQFHPNLAPELMRLSGENSYKQYRREISPANDPRAFVYIRRPLQGPFLINVSYQDGLPRGVAKITLAADPGESYVVERQYFNYQIKPKPVQYYYFEPESFDEMAVVGDCETVPTITVPQNLLNVYAYDCQRKSYYALSEDYPASVLAIAAVYLDNGGAFHRVKIYHHGDVTRASVNVDALHDGKILYHGDVEHWHYGVLKSFRRYDLGEPIGIGIDTINDQVLYVGYDPAAAVGVLAGTELLDKLEGRHTWLQSRLNQQFKPVEGQRIISTSTLAKLKAALLLDINETLAIRKDGEIAGLSDLWHSWQRQSQARIESWKTLGRGVTATETTPTTMKSMLEADLIKWLAESRELVLDDARRQCRRGGQSLDEAQWSCVYSPDQKLAELCEEHLGAEKCKVMADKFGQVSY